MTNLDKLRKWTETAVANGLVDVKFVPGPNCEATSEEIAEEALHLLSSEGEQVRFLGF